MPDRIAHDNPTLETVTGTLAAWGPTDRLCVRVPSTAPVPAGEVVRLVLDGAERRTRTVAREGHVDLRGAYDTPDAARAGGGDATDRLPAWAADRDLSAGRSVHLDVLAEGFRYGLRAPGESATYDDVEPPSTDLSAIAESLGDE